LRNKINSVKVRLSDIRKNKNVKNWTCENSSVKPEPGDIFYGDSEARDAFLKQEYEKSQKVKDLQKQVLREGIKPPVFDEGGNPVRTGNKPDYTQKSVSVTKSFTGAGDKLVEFIENMEREKTSGLSKEEIGKSLDLKPRDVNMKGKRAVIGTFNIEWLGTKPRKEEDYKEIAQVIKDSGAQVLGVEEISKESALQKVMKYLPDYGYILGKSGGQKVGILFDKNRVKYDVNSIDQLDEAVVSSGLRAPLMVNMKIDDGFDFTIMVAHLKAMFDPKSVKKRKEQAREINKWLQNHLKENNDKDVIIVGDFNDFVGSEALNIMDGNLLHYATSETPDGFYSNIPYGGIIDHTSVTTVKGGSSEEYIPGTINTVDEHNYKNYEDRVSDHKPVWFEVRSDIDND